MDQVEKRIFTTEFYFLTTYIQNSFEHKEEQDRSHLIDVRNDFVFEKQVQNQVFTENFEIVLLNKSQLFVKKT